MTDADRAGARQLSPDPAMPTIAHVERALQAEGYLADHGLATAIFLALGMRRPLLLEGEAGVGKTEVATTMARLLGRDLIRLQCYEGIDATQALYEWDYSRQLLVARTVAEGPDPRTRLDELYGPEFLLERPLLRAIRAGSRAVLLVDELDRADDEFEAFLLEILADYAVTVPEVGTLVAEEPPAVIITSNRTRDLHDALKRRCLYHWIDYPSLEREVEIIRMRVPGVSAQLAEAVARTVARVRELDLIKYPGVAEAIDWTAALSLVGASELEPRLAADTVGSVVKHREDLQQVRDLLEAEASVGGQVAERPGGNGG